MDHMDELLDEYLSTLNCTTIDSFRPVFYDASDSQLDDITAKHENATGPIKESMHDDGVQANMTRWLGEKLILISLYHSFEIKLKEIIKCKCPIGNGRDIKLHRWDEMKQYIPNDAKNSAEYQQVNELRVLVNCFKHAGIVSTELNWLQPSFGKVDANVEGEFSVLYESYKKCASFVIKETYEYYRT